ncbi:hypothetical protein C8Q73DRAFT_6190 [Cubamyces lactineus]|nr:hypothetical protein C8Q73DRAFT_6190 [Cubamyces lactineus]
MPGCSRECCTTSLISQTMTRMGPILAPEMSLPLANSAASSATDPSSLFPKLPSLNGTYGAVLIGTYVSLILYGVTLHQAYRYFRLSSSDSPGTKIYVVGLLTLDTFHTVVCMHISYWYLVENYFDPLRLYTGVWSINLLSVLVGVTIISCQCFYARRVYLLGRQYRLLVLATAIMFLAELGCSITLSVKAFVEPSYTDFRKFAWLISVAFGIVVLADVLLTGVLILTLNRSRTGFRRTDSMIDVLILYAMCTGLLTDIFSALIFIFALVSPSNMIYIGCDSVAAKLYVNSVLAALNFRRSFASGEDSGVLAGVVGLFRQPRPDTETTSGIMSSPLFLNSKTSGGSSHAMQRLQKGRLEGHVTVQAHVLGSGPSGLSASGSAHAI